MSWREPALTADQHELVSLLDFVGRRRGANLDDEDPALVADVINQLVELGVWSIGVSEEVGGGGADLPTATVAFERLARYWPALAWAAVQNHAAIRVLSQDVRFTPLVREIMAGAAGVAVVDAASSRLHLRRDGDTISGAVERVDAAHPKPHVLVLGDAEALLLRPKVTAPLLRSGLGGALTRSVQFCPEQVEDSRVLVSADLAEVRARTYVGVAGVASGLASAAVDMALQYASDRIQFGDVLTAIPVVRQVLLDQATTAALMAATCMAHLPGLVQSFAAAQHACDAAVHVAASAVQSHGGYGYLTEYHVERVLRDAISLRAAADLQLGAMAAGRTLVGMQPAFDMSGAGL